MQLQECFLKQIVRTRLVAHSSANKSIHTRSERTIQSLESAKASALIVAHEFIERLGALRLGHTIAENNLRSMIHLAETHELLGKWRKFALFVLQELTAGHGGSVSAIRVPR